METKKTKIIDLRSDTVTKPCRGMRQAMANARVGDDVFGEDPTVRKLESVLAERSGHEAGLFFPSGTQSNLVALLSHCQRGDEYIVGQNAHTYKYEAGGAAVLGSIQPQPLEHADDGTIELEKIESAIKADDVHFAKSKVIALENTIGGKIIPQRYIAETLVLATKHSLALHLDGARVFNAAMGLGCELSDITLPFDSVSICLSKGLGAPVGSVLVARAEVIEEARRWRKMVGGGMRQAGVLAAAGLYALDNNVERLKNDHAMASHLAKSLMGIDGLEVRGGQSHTNMVYLAARENGADFVAACQAQGLLFTGSELSRLVFHKGISPSMVDRAINIIQRYFSDGESA